MKRRLISALMAVIMVAAMLCAFPAAAEEAQEICILFTHDMHSHLEPQPSGDGTIGGFARLKTLIDRESEAAGGALLLDGGDFSMGTLYQAVYETDASELTMMAQLGYVATTFGNHEFDYQGQGVAGMLAAAQKNAAAENTTLPAIICSNIDWSSVNTEDGRVFQQAMEDYGVKENMIVEINGVKVGIFGMMGRDSLDCAPLSPVDFIDIITCAKEQVAELEAQGAELIVCLSHSGVWEEAEKSEDELLAQAVPEIDLIISGHTHTTLNAPIVHGSTHIVSCGEYTTNLGRIVLRREGDDWAFTDYELIPTTDEVPADPEIEELIVQYRDRVSANYLSNFGYTFDQVLCTNPGSLQSENDMLADAVIEAVKAAEGDNYEPVAMAIVPGGIIRGTLPEGEVTTSDAFNILSLGIGPDRIPGYPLVSAYLTGRELYDLAEVDASVSSMMTGTDLYPSGGGWAKMDNRLILSKVSEVWLYDENGEKVEVEKDRLYRVVTDLYSLQMLGTVKSKSFGLLSLEPKDADGKPITDMNSCIIYNADGSEVKAWVALADYLSGMGGADGTGTIDEKYTQPSGRIITGEARGISGHLSNAGRIWYVLSGAVAALILLIVLIVLAIKYIIRLIKRRKAKR